MTRIAWGRLLAVAGLLVLGAKQGIAEPSESDGPNPSTLRPVVLNGVAKLPNGEPLVNSEISVVVKERRGKQTVRRVTTSSNGEFTVEAKRRAIPEWIRIEADGYRVSVAQNFFVAAKSGAAVLELRRHPRDFAAIDSKELRCRLAFPKNEYRVGEPIRPEIRIDNQSKKNALMVGSLDGSCRKLRYPHCYFQVTGPDEHAFRLIGCGTVNELRSEDFVEVASGSVFDPTEAGKDGFGFLFPHRTFRLRKPGEYKIAFVYDSSSRDLNEWLSSSVMNRRRKVDRAELGQLLKAIPHVTLRSETISLKIVE